MPNATISSPVAPAEAHQETERVLYQFLSEGDVIRADDEFISDDGATWVAPPKWTVGMEYPSRIFKSARRIARAADEIERLVTWQPIDTAPRDGTRFLAFEKSSDGSRYECWWQSDFINWEGWQNDWDNEPNPTHWKPLDPEPTDLHQ